MLHHEGLRGKITFWDGVLSIAALATIIALLLAPPVSLLDKVDRAAFAVCHRIPDRSYEIGGRPLPLCARCSGTYLGALAGLVVLGLRHRGRADRFPAATQMAVFAVFLLIWAVDGANSFLTLFPGLPHLYEPRNLLRLVTGTLEGLAIAAFLLPAFNGTVWAPLHAAGAPTEVAAGQSVGGWRDMVWLLVGGAIVVGLVSSELEFLLYPLALASGVMIVGLVGALNGMVVLMVLHRDGQTLRWREAIAPLLAGLALAMIELAAIGLARAALTAWIDLPF